jgi:hypothetical protein
MIKLSRTAKIATLVTIIIASAIAITLMVAIVIMQRDAKTARSTHAIESAEPNVTADKVLTAAYGAYDKKLSCWFADDAESGQRYCMKVDRIDKIQTKAGFRFYVLAAGDAIDEAGHPNGNHLSFGAVGAFVVEDRKDATVFIASDPQIPVGSMGNAPNKWALMQLGPDDYWGWKNTWGDCHQGYCGSRYAVLAPYGKHIRDLAGFVASYEDTGACGDEECQSTRSSLDSTLRVNTSDHTVKVFPIEVIVTGTDGGKELASKTWIMPFDPKKWRYVEPADWPLKMRDF